MSDREQIGIRFERVMGSLLHEPQLSLPLEKLSIIRNAAMLLVQLPMLLVQLSVYSYIPLYCNIPDSSSLQHDASSLYKLSLIRSSRSPGSRSFLQGHC